MVYHDTRGLRPKLTRCKCFQSVVHFRFILGKLSPFISQYCFSRQHTINSQWLHTWNHSLRQMSFILKPVTEEVHWSRWSNSRCDEKSLLDSLRQNTLLSFVITLICALSIITCIKWCFDYCELVIGSLFSTKILSFPSGSWYKPTCWHFFMHDFFIRSSVKQKRFKYVYRY